MLKGHLREVYKKLGRAAQPRYVVSY